MASARGDWGIPFFSGAAGLGINMISAGELFIIDFKQSFANGNYVKAFCEELSLNEISYMVSDPIPFLTPNDSVVKRKI